METLELLRADHLWLTTGIVFVLGSMIGSFMNVCIYRLPEGKSVVVPGSHCACGQPIPFYRNLPILSWILLRGVAPCCGSKFSIQYPVVELLTAAAFALSWWFMPLHEALGGWVLFSFLLVGAWIDWDYLILPDSTTLGLVFVGVLLSFFIPELHGYGGEHWLLDGVRSVGQSLLGMLVGSAVVLWVALIGEYILKKEAIGFGDVKLIGGIGAITGWQGGVFSLFGGALIGTALMLFLFPFWRWWQKRYPNRPLVARKMRLEDYPEADREQVGLAAGKMIPFGPLIALGGLVYYFFMREPVNAYLADVANMIYG